MSLTKRIISCALALSVALGGICATATEPRTEGQKSGNRPLTTREKQIIGGASTVGGVGILSIVGHYLWRYKHKPSDNPPVDASAGGSDRFSDKFEDGFNILIIGEKPENRQKVIEELKNGKYDYPSHIHPSSSLKGIAHDCMTSAGRTLKETTTHEMYCKADKSKKPWHILGCDTKDTNATNLIKRAHLIIAVLDDTQASDNNIGQLLSDNDAKQHSRILTLIDYNRTVPNTSLKGARSGDPTIKECIDFLRQYDTYTIHTSFLTFEHMDVLLSDFAYYWEVSPQGVNNHLFYRYVTPRDWKVPSTATVADGIKWIKYYQEHPKWGSKPNKKPDEPAHLASDGNE